MVERHQKNPAPVQPAREANQQTSSNQLKLAKVEGLSCRQKDCYMLELAGCKEEGLVAGQGIGLC